MNELRQLESLGLVLPPAGYIVGAILFGVLGYVVFRRGRKAAKPPLVWIGVVMMLYPYAVSQTWLLWVMGVLLCVWGYIKWN